MTPNPIDTLCRALLDELRRDPRGTGVTRCLGAYASEHRDWREWAFFDEAVYTRNLVHRCASFELLLLGWNRGQESPIHDHADQNCWMAVLDGEVEEVHFRPAGAGRPLIAGPPRRFERGQVAFIQDSIALHLVRPAGGRPAVSLHLYSNPIDRCRTYDRETGEASHLEVGYHSVRGELCAGRTAAAVRSEFA